MDLLLVDMRLFLVQLCLKVSLLLVQLRLEVSLLLCHLFICLLDSLLLVCTKLLRNFQLISEHLDVFLKACIHLAFALQLHLNRFDL